MRFLCSVHFRGCQCGTLFVHPLTETFRDVSKWHNAVLSMPFQCRGSHFFCKESRFCQVERPLNFPWCFHSVYLGLVGFDYSQVSPTVMARLKKNLSWTNVLFSFINFCQRNPAVSATWLLLAVKAAGTIPISSQLRNNIGALCMECRQFSHNLSSFVIFFLSVSGAPFSFSQGCLFPFLPLMW